ncbi:MAG: hypothetical protein ACPW61_08980 [Methyloligella sp. ZOD6]
MDDPIATSPHAPNPDWAAIEHAYAHDPRKLTEIASDFGVSRQKIQARAKLKDWRRAGADDAPGFDERDAGIEPGELARAEEASGARRTRMVARLFKALEEKMTQLEMRIARGSAAEESAADAEREARALSALAGLYAKLVELDEGECAKGTAKRHSEAAGDADQFREDLARRLERLNRPRDA